MMTLIHETHALRNGTRFRLGLPHLSAHGLSESWLLGQAVERHWNAVAQRAGHPASAIRDLTGMRAFPCIVAARVQGNLGVFAEDADVRLEQARAPEAANGWHSRHVLRDLGGDPRDVVTVELVSRFARRGGSSNRDLEAAEMPSWLTPPADEALPLPVRAFRARARAVRGTETPKSAPIASVPVLAEPDLNGAGLLDGTAFLRFFAAAETVALAGPWRVGPVTGREIHLFANADPGDRIDLRCDLRISQATPTASTRAVITAHRGSDGALVAACETVRGE